MPGSYNKTRRSEQKVQITVGWDKTQSRIAIKHYWVVQGDEKVVRVGVAWLLVITKGEGEEDYGSWIACRIALGRAEASGNWKVINWRGYEASS